MKLPENELRDIARLPEDGQPLPDKYWLLLLSFGEAWTGDYIFQNKRQSFRIGNDRNLAFTMAYKAVKPGNRNKITVKSVDIFDNDTMKIAEAGR